MKGIFFLICIAACFAVGVQASRTFGAQDAKSGSQTPPKRKYSDREVKDGGSLFARNCSACHESGEQQGAFDLHTFPPDQHDRFIDSVTNGKNTMPGWAGILKPEEIEDLWAYVYTDVLKQPKSGSGDSGASGKTDDSNQAGKTGGESGSGDGKSSPDSK